MNFNIPISDSVKFKIISQAYHDKFVNATHFSKLIGVGRSTVYNWLKSSYKIETLGRDEIIMQEGASINTKSKIKICNIFGLLDKIWSDRFYSSSEFRDMLDKYKKIENKKKVIRENNILTGVKKEIDDNFKVNNLSKEEINLLLDNRLKNKTASFKFNFAKLLTNKNRVIEALKVLEWIESDNSSFKYIYENQIKHLKAILLSHSKIGDWDGAIDILRSLYHSASYHLVEPEIITLLASNYKRKALDGVNSKDEINLEFITSALCLYEDAYNLKPDNSKYYDAINMAYLYKIVDAIEVEYANRVDIETLYRDLNRVWKKGSDTMLGNSRRLKWSSTSKFLTFRDYNYQWNKFIKKHLNWWETSTHAEFLILLGEVDIALSFIYDFVENYQIKPFEIDATIRQLNLYVKFTDDKNAKEFLDNLREIYDSIKSK